MRADNNDGCWVNNNGVCVNKLEDWDVADEEDDEVDKSGSSMSVGDILSDGVLLVLCRGAESDDDADDDDEVEVGAESYEEAR